MKYESDYTEKYSTRPATGGDVSMLAASIGFCWLLVFLLAAGVIGFLWRNVDGAEVHLGQLFVLSIAIASAGTLHLFRWIIAEIWVDLGLFRNTERSGITPQVLEQPAQVLEVKYIQNNTMITVLQNLHVDKNRLVFFASAVLNGQSLSKDNWQRFFGKDSKGELVYDNIYRQLIHFRLAEPISETTPNHGIRLTRGGQEFMYALVQQHSPTHAGDWSNWSLEEPTDTNQPKLLDIKENNENVF